MLWPGGIRHAVLPARASKPMVRFVTFIVIILFAFLVAVVFAAINPEPMSLDLAFAEFQLKTSLALLAFLATGWVFGVLCAGFLMLKMLSERRQLRKSLRLAEAEVKSLRSMPMQDAH
ncbi:MAG: LapA family protein [Gammaproteobacteria bacterium]|nr:LapA family protein [Gammaproteobacteria bacterium]